MDKIIWLDNFQIGKNPIGASGAFALLSAVGKNDNGTVHLLDLTVSLILLSYFY